MQLTQEKEYIAGWEVTTLVIGIAFLIIGTILLLPVIIFLWPILFALDTGLGVFLVIAGFVPTCVFVAGLIMTIVSARIIHKKKKSISDALN